MFVLEERMMMMIKFSDRASEAQLYPGGIASNLNGKRKQRGGAKSGAGQTEPWEARGKPSHWGRGVGAGFWEDFSIGR